MGSAKNGTRIRTRLRSAAVIDKAFKKKWVAALRSGEYQQARKLLRSKDDKFCCLGVACDVFDPDLWVVQYYHVDFNDRNHNDGIYAYDDFNGNEEDGLIPPMLMKFIGLSASERTELVRMNDDLYYSLAQIADWIEANL